MAYQLDSKLLSSCHINFLFGAGVNGSGIYNDLSEQTTRLIKLFYKYNTNEIINKLEELIRKYGLSDSEKNGYEYYGCNSSNGLGQYNKKPFAKLRSDYNLAKKSIEKDFMLLLLTIYSFNNQIRFNSSGLYNLPVGKRDFNDINFKQFDKPFFYCDPPYLLGDASYNENGGWDETKETELLQYLKELSHNGIKFALSNVLEHKGNTNTILLNWAIDNKFNIIYLNKNYSNSNYQIKDKNNKTTEVLITNY